jgi:integrase/recombinase XerD
MADDPFQQPLAEEIATKYHTELALNRVPPVPALLREAGPLAQRRFLEFFTADIRNPGTRGVYAHAVNRFCVWCVAWL